ncbi:MAG: DUF6602 domain-containing protein [Methylococcales bacterium]
MIEKASELLEKFIKAESEKLQGIEMLHMPTLGSAYEEVTKQGIDSEFTIPKFLNLRVVSGFISIGNEMLPHQIDCMLVHGDGSKYGLTEQYIYNVDKVLCVFEVKKTLRKAEFVDAVQHLDSIRTKFAEHFEYKLINESYEPNITVAAKEFSKITGKVAPDKYSDIHGLSENDAILFYVLVQDSLAPISIIHGYGGYKTEEGLRNTFVDIIEEKIQNEGNGLGITSIPTLVTSNQFSLIKCNGVPFSVINDKNEWVAICSTRHNPAKMILEMIWSKISIHFNVDMPWDDKLYMDNIQPLLIAEVVEHEGRVGWKYESLELKEKHLKRKDDNSWRPAAIGKAEVAAIRLMMLNGGYLKSDDQVEEFLRNDHGTTFNEVIESFILTRLFISGEGYLKPINVNTYIMITDDDEGFIASERDRFDLWCNENELEPSYISFMFLE